MATKEEMELLSLVKNSTFDTTKLFKNTLLKGSTMGVTIQIQMDFLIFIQSFILKEQGITNQKLDNLSTQHQELENKFDILIEQNKQLNDKFDQLIEILKNK